MVLGEVSRLNVVVTATDRASAKLSGITSRLGGLKTMMVGAGAMAAVYMGKRMVDSFASFEKVAADSFAMFDNLTKKQKDGMRDMAWHLAKQYAGWVNATDAMKSFFWVGSSGIKDYNTAMGIASKSAQFATANAVDMAEATKLAMQLMKTWGFTLDELPYRLDQVTMAMKSGMLNMTDLIETMKYASGAGAALQLDFKEMLAVFDIFADASVAGSQAGTAFRRTLANMIKPSGDVLEYMEKLNLSFFDKSTGTFIGMKNALDEIYKGMMQLPPEEREAYIATMTGIRAWSGMTTVIKKLNTEYPELIENIKKATGVTEEMAGEKIDSAAGKWGRLSTTIGEVKYKLGNMLYDYGIFVTNWNSYTAALTMPLLPLSGIFNALKALFWFYDNWVDVSHRLSETWYGMATTFADTFVNPIINGINAVIKGLNKIPGVSIKLLKEWKPEMPAWMKRELGNTTALNTGSITFAGREIMSGTKPTVNVNNLYLNTNNPAELWNEFIKLGQRATP